MVRRIGLVCLVALVSLAACERKGKSKDRLYFSDLKPPVGLKRVTVLSDVSLNKPTGGEIKVELVVAADEDKDEINRLLRALHRQVSKRSGFVGKKISSINIRVYDSAAKGKAAGGDWLAQLTQQGGGKAQLTNHQLFPLKKYVKKALGKQPQYTKDNIKPSFTTDPQKMTASVTLPFVKQDGSGDWVKKVTYTRATSSMTATLRSLFDNIDELKEATFIGTHQGETIIKVTLKRAQYDALSLSAVEEALGKFSGQFANKLYAGQIKHTAVAKKVAKERRRLYKDVFSRIPAEQFTLAKTLK